MAAPSLRSDPEFLAFWQERHVGFLSTTRPDGTHHLVPVGVTYDSEVGIARVITSSTSKKARNIIDSGPDAVVAVSQADGARWATLEGIAV